MIEKYSYKYIRSLTTYKIIFFAMQFTFSFLIAFVGTTLKLNAIAPEIDDFISYNGRLWIFGVLIAVFVFTWIIHFINFKKFKKIQLVIVNDEVSDITQTDLKEDFKGFILFKATSDKKLEKLSELSEQQKNQIIQKAKNSSIFSFK
ncbi:hypothetical protein [Mycoplasma procyoni]|uniref:hypothetical protein n=1 Tax=Mycoplasma procyoni TaxID=568784 RepID=UPI00197BBFA4|nr:hypothetical protein [Mycoplasma procyoni]MBN3534911.1 hypothetical protein [Mycoplasma procyoni]